MRIKHVLYAFCMRINNALDTQLICLILSCAIDRSASSHFLCVTNGDADLQAPPYSSGYPTATAREKTGETTDGCI
jgi:hypothetical protein